MLLFCSSLSAQNFFIGHNEEISDSINRAWYPYEIIDSIVFPDRKEFIIIENNAELKELVSECEKGYILRSQEKPFDKKRFAVFYPDSSYEKYYESYKYRINKYKKYAEESHVENNQFTRLIVIQNTSQDTILIPTQDKSLIGLIEAKTNKNIWAPIEFWWFSWCGESYNWINLLPNHSLIFGLKSDIGPERIEMRLKIHGNDTIFYSPEFVGGINSTQFEVTQELKNIMQDYFQNNVFLDSIRYGLCQDELDRCIEADFSIEY